MISKLPILAVEFLNATCLHLSFCIFTFGVLLGVMNSVLYAAIPLPVLAFPAFFPWSVAVVCKGARKE